MPRIRTIKPEFFQDEKLAPLAPLDRLVFLGLISMADDAGRLLDNVKVIDAFIFPCSDDSSGNALRTLADLGRIVRYTSSSGQKLIQIRNWGEHQKVEKPNKHVLPAPSDDDLQGIGQNQALTAFPDGSPNDRGTTGDDSPTLPRYDLGPTTTDLGPTTKQHARKKPRAARTAAPDTWLTPALVAWQKHNGPGSLAPGKAAKLLAPLHAAGIAPDEIGRRLDRYCAARKGARYCTLQDFAEHHAEWASPPPEALVRDGWFTDELERETRPAGLRENPYGPLPSGVAS